MRFILGQFQWGKKHNAKGRPSRATLPPWPARSAHLTLSAGSSCNSPPLPLPLLLIGRPTRNFRPTGAARKLAASLPPPLSSASRPLAARRSPLAFRPIARCKLPTERPADCWQQLAARPSVCSRYFARYLLTFAAPLFRQSSLPAVTHSHTARRA